MGLFGNLMNGVKGMDAAALQGQGAPGQMGDLVADQRLPQMSAGAPNLSMLQGVMQGGLKSLLTPENMQLIASTLADLGQGGGPKNLLATLATRKEDARAEQERQDKIAAANQPKYGVDGGYGYSIGKAGVKWGERRPETPSEIAAAARVSETDEMNAFYRDLRMKEYLERVRKNQAGEGIQRSRVGVAQQNANTGSYRARKGGAGGASQGLPPGFKIRGQ